MEEVIAMPLAEVIDMEVDVEVPTHEEIAARAHMLFEQRGHADGHDVSDWLEAENQLIIEHRERLYGVH